MTARDAIALILVGAALCASCSPKAENNATQVGAPLSPEQIPNLIIDANAEMARNNFGRTIEITYRISKFDPNYIDSYVLRAQAMVMLGKKEEALNALEAAFEHGLKDITQIEEQSRLGQLRELPEYRSLISRYGIHSTAALSPTEIRAGNVSIKEEGGNQVIKAGDISITVPKD